MAMLAVLVLIAGTSVTATGRTAIIRDIEPGLRSSAPGALTKAGDMVFFTSSRYDSRGRWDGEGLWRTKGSRSSTRSLTTYFGEIDPLGNVEGTLTYLTDDCWRSGCDRLTSDGTRKGTGVPDPDIDDRIAALPFAKLGGVYLYAPFDRPHLGRRLMRSEDGNQASGVSVYAYPDDIWGLTKVGGHVYFAVDDGVHGSELWRTDGTTAGTTLVADISPGPTGSVPQELTAVAGRLYFTANARGKGRELWVTTGSAASTRVVRDIMPGSASSGIRDLTRVGKRLFFVADDGRRGKELWKSDGTWKGTKRVKDIWRGSKESQPRELTAVAGRLYFTAIDGRHGGELWVSGGTARSTRLVKDIWRGSRASTPLGLTRLGRKLIFTADHPAYGREVWIHIR